MCYAGKVWCYSVFVLFSGNSVTKENLTIYVSVSQFFRTYLPCLSLKFKLIGSTDKINKKRLYFLTNVYQEEVVNWLDIFSALN